MSKLAEMLHGDLDTVDSWLEQECEQQELRAAMQNILRRVKKLEIAASEPQF